jgi:hypothetical protein
MVPAEPPVLTWRQHDKYCLLSTDGRYSVAKYGGGVPSYSAWRTVKHECGRLLLVAGLSDAQSAKARCEHDQAT